MSHGPGEDAEILRVLASVSAEITRGRPLAATLQAVADAVVAGVGFGVALVNFVLPGGDLRIAAATGPPGVRESLLGKVAPRAVVDDMLARSVHWGGLRYVPHGDRAMGEEYEWVPDVVRPDGSDAWDPGDALLAPLHGSSGELVGLLSVDLPPRQRRPDARLCELLEMFAVQAGIAIDNARLVDELRRERDRLAGSEMAYRFLFTASAGAMATVSLEPGDLGRIVQANDAMGRLLGYAPADLEGAAWSELVVEAERAESVARLRTWRSGAEHRGERRLVRRDGGIVWTELTGKAVESAVDGRSVFLVHVHDITSRKTREAELVAEANADPLTGLPNRRALFGYLETVLRNDGGPAPAGVVVYADLDGFKQVNDRYGHAVGDRVLEEAARRLAAQVRHTDIVARLGGDEFAIVAAGLDDDAAAQLLARIRHAFSAPMEAVPDRRCVSVSLGMARVDGDGDAHGLLHRADMAMFVDKHPGGAH